MINRVLIRIKVIQLLYSYLLTENQFMLESQPSAPTKEKRFAYNLYLDTLVLMVRIAEKVERRGLGTPLADTRFITKIKADEKVRTLLHRYHMEHFPFEDIVAPLADIVKESAIYKRFLKDLGNFNAGSDAVWQEIFNIIISPYPEYNALIEKRENFTFRGVDRMKEMMAHTFVNFLATRDNLDDALAQLKRSLDKARELYLRLLSLPVDITFLRNQQLDNNRYKYIRTEEDLNPNLRFVENQLVEVLSKDTRISAELKNRTISWLPDDRDLLERLLKLILESDLYKEYMEFPVTDYKTDCELWRNLMKQVILPSKDFLEYMEEKSVFWNDDLEIIGTFALKTLKRFEDGNEEDAVLAMFKDKEDAEFGPELLARVVRNKDLYRGWINGFIDNSSWDTDRLAFMDVVIIMTALAEITGFPSIPLTVSMNEYIEIAKCYSTPKSGSFVHGVLAAIVNRLQEDGILLKKSMPKAAEKTPVRRDVPVESKPTAEEEKVLKRPRKSGRKTVRETDAEKMNNE